jgi:hypothetical protein
MRDAASPGDSLQLPLAVSGTIVTAFVEGIQFNMIAFFAKEGTDDTLFGAPNNTQFDIPPTGLGGVSILICCCPEDGLWVTNYPPDGFP